MYLTHGGIISAHYMQDKLINVDRLQREYVDMQLIYVNMGLIFFNVDMNKMQHNYVPMQQR